MKDYRVRGRQRASSKHKEALREVAIKRVEAGHRRVRAYAVAWGKLSQEAAGSSRMSCYRVLKSEGLIQPKRVGQDLRQAAEQRRQRLKAPEKINEVLQGDFTDYVTEDGEKYRIGAVTEYLSRFNLVSEVLDTETLRETLTKVRMVGTDMKLDDGIGTCGKDGQSVPVGVGQPSLKITGLTVGGTSL